MKVTMHSGKRGNIKHNEHDPMTKNASWDKSRTKDNYIWTPHQNVKNPAESELLTYNILFGETLKKQNEKHMANRQYKRVRDMETWKETSQHRPSETILQIGDKNQSVDDKTLWACVAEFINWKQEKFSSNYQVISVSDHEDETTPHCHVVEVWYYHDEDGNAHPGIKGAMRELGVPLPNPNEPEGKDNYRKAVVDAECREKWQEICLEHGLDIDTQPDRRRKVGHLGKKQYKAYADALEQLQDEYQSMNDDLQKQKEALQKQMKENEMLIHYGKMALNALEKQKRRKELDKRAEMLGERVNRQSSTSFDLPRR